jgi:hypothetical protein
VRSTRILAWSVAFFASSIGSALAGVNDPISFSQAGTVSLTLNQSNGGFDHILELANTLGPIGTPIIALTEVVAPSADVLGYPPALLNDTVAVGSFAANEELVLRLTNVESVRLGTPGTLSSQIFSGSASNLNPNPADLYTYVEFVDATTIRVYWEDVFPLPANDPDPASYFLSGGGDIAFTLSLTPVPEPATAMMLIIGLAFSGVVRRSR